LNIWPYIKIKVRKGLVKKGSWKDPFLYLRLFCLFLFLILPLGINLGFYQLNQDDSCIFSGATEEDSFFVEKGLFLEQKDSKIAFDLVLLQENSLVGLSAPTNFSFQVLGAISEQESETKKEEKKEIIEYVVESGENISSIAQKFNISKETIIWANNLNPKSSLKVGQKLIILPVSGILHYVKSGETLSQIAKIYQASYSEIVSFNELTNENDIRAGDMLIVPNGKKPNITFGNTNQKSQIPQSAQLPQIPLADSYFICPITPPCKITQGLHWNNAVDFSNGKCGSPIYAAAQGQILKVKYGYNYGAGNYLTILHPNNVITFYGHLQTILVKEGDVVSQGQIVALMGGKPGMSESGISTGCHLHFGVQGAENPFAK